MLNSIPADGKIVFDSAPAEKTVFLTGDLIPREKAEINLVRGKVEAVFGTVLPEIRSSDLAVTNLETALTFAGTPIRKFGPALRADPASLPGLVKAGFTVFSLANNHSRDFGDEAFLETMRHIQDAGARFAGGGKNRAEAALPLRLTLGSFRLSIFAAALDQPCSATEETPGSNPLNPAALAAAIADEKPDADFILVTIHDGKEHIPFPSRRVRENCRAFIDAGASAVVGHHPHISQGLEQYHGGLIAYSLGNFHFPARNKPETPGFWNRAFSLRLHLRRNGVTSIDILPHSNDPETDRIDLMTGERKQNFLEELSRLNRILADNALCDRYYAAAALPFAPHYFAQFKEAFQRQQDGDDSPEARNKMFYCFQCLNNGEHWDLLRSLTAVFSSEEPFLKPNDVDDFTRKD
ncbi:MAG: Capsule biosynthesis protein CapA [Lentisphaerae bacterium ADurb.Bin242]|nr:MAG: Capsule biosynthesis protein CapA [Lentisphaerae bacterium ADurb.Bin242]